MIMNQKYLINLLWGRVVIIATISLRVNGWIPKDKSTEKSIKNALSVRTYSKGCLQRQNHISKTGLVKSHKEIYRNLNMTMGLAIVAKVHTFNAMLGLCLNSNQIKYNVYTLP